MRLASYLAAVVTAVALVCALPSAAFAFTVLRQPGTTATVNAYGLWYGGSASCGQDGCHPNVVAQESPHSNMVHDISADSSPLLPAPGSSSWPFGTFTNPYQPSDVYLQLGDRLGFLEYTGSPTQTRVTLNPLDDLPVWGTMEWHIGDERWDATATTVTGSAYVQSCGDCHNVGVTRPSNGDYTLPNGAHQTTQTPTTVSALSIGCEVCHGTGSDPSASSHATDVPAVVGGTQILKAQVCGQCHETGTTPQKNRAGSAFSNPNGFTTNQRLSDYLTLTTPTPPSDASMTAYARGIGAKPADLPNGDDYSQRHDYYNEWVANIVTGTAGGRNGHAAPTNPDVVSSGNDKCLGCHSGLGFLNRIGARWRNDPTSSLIVTAAPTLAQVQASDPGISCQICHTGHVTYNADNTTYDSVRTWNAGGRKVNCADCHNWQYEVLGQSVQTETITGTTYTRPAANTALNHPEREMVSGGNGGDLGNGGMWGVLPTGEFMSNGALRADCKDCHMPRTYREGSPLPWIANGVDNGETEGTRMSHRFHPLLPGDAARWDVRPMGDSCTQSGCHEGTVPGDNNWTRADFEAWIDNVTATVAAASADATGVLDSEAQNCGLADSTSFLATQPASGPGSTVDSGISAGEWDMLQRAVQNVDFVVKDGSLGLHQPQYTLAGLAVAKFYGQSFQPNFWANPDTTHAYQGAGVIFSGNLSDWNYDAIIATGTVAPVVALEKSTDGGATWSTVTTVVADPSTGDFAMETGMLTAPDTIFRCEYAPLDGVTYTTSTYEYGLPVTTLQVAPASATTTWAPQSVTASLSVASGTDALTFYSVSGAGAVPPQPYGGPFTISADGTSTIWYWSTNSSGSESIHFQNVYVDSTGPIVTSSAVANYAYGTAVFDVSATDAHTSVASITYSLDGRAPYIGPSNHMHFGVMVLGSHELVVSFTDACGNKSATSTIDFVVRRSPAISTDATSTYLDSATLHLTALSDSGGPFSLAYNVDAGPTMTVGAATATVLPAITDVGTHTVTAFATDGIGMKSGTYAWTFLVRSAPVIAKTTAATLTIKHGVTVKFGATLKRPNGVPVSGKILALQRSTNGRTWTTYSLLPTGATGAVTPRSVKIMAIGTTYWRWFFAGDQLYKTYTSAATKVVSK